MYKEEKPKKTENITTDDIISSFPKKDFILVLGTSHSAGSCQIGDYTKLDKKESWIGVLEQRLQMPIMNLAVPGNHNSTMVHQLQDCFDLGVMDKCKLIIVEGRLRSKQGHISVDAFQPNADPLFGNELNFNRDVVSGKDVGPSETSNTYADSYLLNYSVGGWNKKPDYLKKAIENFYTENEVQPKHLAKSMEDYIRNHFIWFHSTTHEEYKNLSDIRSMQTMAHLSGIKFLWFAWNGKYPVVQQKDKKHLSTLYYVSKISKDFWKLDDTCLLDDIQFELVNDTIKEEDLLCECDHWTSSGHKWIASRMIAKVSQCLKN